MRSASAAVAAFGRLDLDGVAFLLDVDGTLLDIAPQPDAVEVPPELRRTLGILAARVGGALALVSGRTIADLDRLFAPLVVPAIGSHGAEIRSGRGRIIATTEPLPERLRRVLREAEGLAAGIVIEDKRFSMALHYRKAPGAEPRLRRFIEAVRADFPGEILEVLPGKAVLEVKRPGISKGEAVRRLAGEPPFAGRRPVFVGDDITDESVFAVLPALGGIGFSVARPLPGVAGVFDTPAALRSALQNLAHRV
ncbi:MAG: trehalose-phosphatase [Pseudolabrys sp.]|nr:trehalose-phosphatase [Pseudolabrys sp.]